MQLSDNAVALWLPIVANVFAEFTQPGIFSGFPSTLSFHNEHRYANYQVYHVSVKMLTDPPKTASQSGYVLPAEESDQRY